MNLDSVRAVLARLENATGATSEREIRDIEYAIANAIVWTAYVPPWLRSIDAADALRRRVLPGTRRVSGENEWGPFYAAIDAGEKESAASVAPTEPLAILLATIRALIAKGETS